MLVTISRDYFHPNEVLDVVVDGEHLKQRVCDTDTSRSIWFGDEIVVKVDRDIPQAQREACTWMKLEPEDRQYFATPLQVGEDYVVQERIPILNPRELSEDEYHAAWMLVSKMFEKYMKWDQQGSYDQYKVDARTRMVVIHDYPDTSEDECSHSWDTISVAGRAR